MLEYYPAPLFPDMALNGRVKLKKYGMYEEKMASFYDTDVFNLLSGSHDQALTQLKENSVAPKEALDG